MSKIAALLLIPLLAACGAGASTPTAGSGSGVPTVAASVTSATAVGAATTASEVSSASPTPTSWTVAQACIYYRTVLKPVDKASDQFNVITKSWTKKRAGARALTTSITAVVPKLKHPPYPWPTEMQADVATITKGYLAIAGLASNMGAASDVSAFDYWVAKPWMAQTLQDDWNIAQSSITVTCG